MVGLLAACGGGGGPPDQARPVPNELTGYATDGRNVQTAEISAKGAAGPARTNGASGNPARTYSVSTQNLTAPYMVASPNNENVSVAVAQGRVNVTPLTSLLTIALFGQAPADAFNDYGDASTAQIALINDAEIRRAQADATDFLENTLQVTVRSGSASFVSAAFEPAAGDTMWDTLVALNSRIAELGPDTYAALLADFQQRQHQCRKAQLQIAIGSATTRFCPATTTSTPDASDAGVLEHVYSQATGETLSVRVRGDAVVDASFVTADGARHACSGAGCAGIALGQAAFDTTRSVTFGSVTLAGGSGSPMAIAIGQVTTTVPHVTLGDLPCLIGSLHKIRDDGSVESACVDNSTALFFLNVTGTLGSQQGASTHADYLTNGISIVLKGDELVSITATVPSADGSTSVTAECRGADCQGVTIDAATVNMNLGIQTDTRAVTLAGTVLRTVTADGGLSGETPVRLKASLRLISYSNVEFNSAAPNATPTCTGAAVVAQLVPDDTPQWLYQVCSGADGPASIYGTPLDDGGLLIDFNGQITITTDAGGGVVRARVTGFYSGGTLSESFGCDGLESCRGVQVGPADADGHRRVAIAGASFHNVAFDGFASGPRTGRVDAAFDVLPSGV